MKLRAYSTYNNEMYYNSDLNYIFVIHNDYIAFEPIHFKDELSLFSTNGNEEEHIIISYYTGLTDKYNKEIYQGDILKVDGFENMDKGFPSGILSHIYGVNQKYTPTIDTVIMDDLGCYVLDEKQNRVYLRDFNEISEVIGNIYQTNKE